MVESELGVPASDEIRALMRWLVLQGRTPERLRRSQMQSLRHAVPEVPRAACRARIRLPDDAWVRWYGTAACSLGVP